MATRKRSSKAKATKAKQPKASADVPRVAQRVQSFSGADDPFCDECGRRFNAQGVCANEDCARKGLGKE
jgi:hypothetical protein